MKNKKQTVMSTLCNIYFTLTVIGLILTKAVYSEARVEVPELQVDAIRHEYIALQKSLWLYLDKEGPSKSSELRKVYDSHRKFINDNFQSNFEVGRYDILNHFEWSLLERDLLQIDRMFDYYQVRNTYIRMELINLEKNMVAILNSIINHLFNAFAELHERAQQFCRSERACHFGHLRDGASQ